VNKHMRILVVSCTAWRDDNNIGNSYTNIFQGLEDIEIAHICCGSGIPNTKFVERHFHISEKNIIKNLLNNHIDCGCEFNSSKLEDFTPIGNINGFFDFMRNHRLQIFFWVRDIIWSFGNWKSSKLIEFVDSFDADIIFAPFLDTSYLNEMLLFLHKYVKKPIILYAWDDVYTLKQFSLSPLYWMNRFYQRHKLKRIASISSAMYTISDFQKKKYSNIFHMNCNILIKGYGFNSEMNFNKITNDPIKLVFTGNIGHGRWETLAQIGQALQFANKDGMKAHLFIYTMTPMSSKMKKALDIKNSVILMGGVPATEIPKIQKDADILVHVESFHLKEKLIVKFSFSTKLVDYFATAKCIFAVGSIDVASIDYLIKNDAAVVATSQSEILGKIKLLVQNTNLIKEYNEKAWDCGKRNHQIDEIQQRLYKDLRELCDGS
jgi:hypothetical protein